MTYKDKGFYESSPPCSTLTFENEGGSFLTSEKERRTFLQISQMSFQSLIYIENCVARWLLRMSVSVSWLLKMRVARSLKISQMSILYSISIVNRVSTLTFENECFRLLTLENEHCTFLRISQIVFRYSISVVNCVVSWILRMRSVLQRSCRKVVRCVAMCCSVMQCDAVWCSVLQ